MPPISPPEGEASLSTLLPGEICSEVLYLFSSFATWKSWDLPCLAPQTLSTSTGSVQKHTHCPDTLTALFTASHWCLYQS